MELSWTYPWDMIEIYGYPLVILQFAMEAIAQL
jgi:hypothetical protein